MSAPRVDWVDTAKGICIIFVVMMHSVLGVEAAAGETGWMHAVVAFAAPFRMPDFFLISGLFLSNVITRDWKLYLDRKVVHFAYFYVLWMTIQFVIKAPVFIEEMGAGATFDLYLLSFIEPFGTLWFIYMLPIFFVVSKIANDRGIPWQVVLALGALLQIAPIHTGWLLVDEFASRFVFFYAGYVFAPHIFRLAGWARERIGVSLGYLLAWGLVNGGLVYAGWAAAPGIALVLGAAGAGAIILTSALIVRWCRLDFLRHFGENSIVIYLAFFFPMGVTRVTLLKLGFLDIGTMSLIVTLVAAVSPMILFWIIQRTNMLRFLFRRPQWAYLRGTFSGKRQAQAAE
ncbi:acyltransferase family protein [Roseibium sediminicola]|uniref:Acyltransferase family protein n=1 Tax=Roseibium sediminicola TaxID=2933272 RepID=A0ABT0H2F8_9HYPH|nr:acyltransferase family protein [Roseibium sp. CAU 1639]MCK7615268.1 acyltransferase family protein [Roseibium sp. CAU 1639]